jgi:hypothetical protein
MRDQVDVFAGLRVEPVGVLVLLEDLADDDGAVLARTVARRDGASGLRDRTNYNAVVPVMRKQKSGSERIFE